MFENLKKLLTEEAEAEKAERRFYIQNGYCETWHPADHQHSDRGLEKYSTSRRWDQYQAGEIAREKAVELATIRSEKEIAKRHAGKLEKLERIAAAPDLIDVSISVEWKRNPTWGYNPTAYVTVHTQDGWKEYTASASGCGYDKRTAAVGSALNQSRSILKMLYSTKEKALNNPPAVGRFNGVYHESPTTNASLIHYGAGYGTLPYFEGGVGMSSFYGVFEACGFKCLAQHETKHTDYYNFSKVEE